MKPELKSTAPATETAVLVAVLPKGESDAKALEYLHELDFLTTTLNLVVLKRFTQKLDRPEASTYVGKGKLEEIRLFVQEHKVTYAIFDDELSASQVKNINKELKLNIYDRSLLILEIFERRAQTAQARTQVELAKNQYLLPRLTRMWTHLERQRGGTGTRGGAGEKEIETDRRIVRDRIAFLKDELKRIDKINATQRKSRSGIVRVAIVGYTNVGKSTLMNLLTKSDVLAENKLFATVDATVRKLVWENIPFLLSDTVGFIRKLPHQLIESFKSTLNEAIESDILLHVVDASHPNLEEQIDVVNHTLAEINAIDKPTVLVFNKWDKIIENSDAANLEENTHPENLAKGGMEYLHSRFKTEKTEIVFISATENLHIENLRATLTQKIKEKHLQIYPNYLPLLETIS